MEQDQQVRSYVHLAQLPRADDALRLLKRIASAVKPIMRNHNWRVGELAEFYPSQANLLGLNVNRGQQICIRLRHAGDKTLFLSLDQVIDTMLHELCHNLHGPHNAAFHALWEKLRDEHLTLTLSGYTGASFVSEGRRLGGGAAPVSARERGRILRTGGGGRTLRGSAGVSIAGAAGRRLGGVMPALTPEMRRAAAAEAAERRKRALEGCGAETLDEVQIRDMGDAARRNGFRTQAEEDRANDVAIARALAELMGEQPELPQAQRSLPPATAQAGSGSSNRLSARAAAPTPSRTPTRTASTAKSRLVTMMEHGRPTGAASGHYNRGSSGSRSSNRAKSSVSAGGWVCSLCTLYNPREFLCCDACGNEAQTEKEPAAVIDLT